MRNERMTPLDAALESYKQEVSKYTSSVASNIAKQIKELMRAQNLTQADLALNIGIKPPQVSRLLNHPANMNLSTIVGISMALNAEIDIVINQSLNEKQKLLVDYDEDTNITPHVNWQNDAHCINNDCSDDPCHAETAMGGC